MYDILAYGRMISSRVRFHAYMEALRTSIKPGSVALDLGCGPGIMALLACKFGARKVYAIEASPIISLAREVAASNGLADKIEFFEGLSTKVTLPEPVNVIVSDLNGILPWHRQHLPSIADARRRFLAPRGVLIPKKEVIWLGIADSESAYAFHTRPWEADHGFNMEPARLLGTNTPCMVGLKPDDLLSAPQRALVLDFTQIEEPNSTLEAEFVMSRSGTAYGVLAWFDAALTDEIGFSNGPGCCQSIYQQTFFPWTKPVSLAPGDIVRVKLRCNLVGDDYVFRWNTQVWAQGKRTEVKAKFDQTDFRALLVSQASLQKAEEAFVPHCNGDASVDTFILKAMDGHASVGEIAAALSQSFPEKFQLRSQALDRVARLSQAYSE